MCNFLSAIVLPSGEVFTDPEHTDSHEDLIACRGLADNGLGGFVRVEFTPANGEYHETDQYQLCLDEYNAPEWWTTEVADRTAEYLRERVRRMVKTSEEIKILLGGCWILAGDVKVLRAKRVRIVQMRGSSQVGKIWGSSQVGEMWDSSQVGEIWGSSQVGEMWGSSQVGKMWDSSQVGKIWESSQVGEMWGSSQVGDDKRTKKD